MSTPAAPLRSWLATAVVGLGVLVVPGVAAADGTLTPTIDSVAPNPFSPNGDGVKDTTKVAYSLDPAAPSQSVTVDVRDGLTGVRHAALGIEPAGSFTWRWDGTDDRGRRVADGLYTIVITTSGQVGGAPASGTVSRNVRVDTAAPTMSSISGNGATFYPYRDGYKDVFTPGVVLGESGTLKLTVTDPSSNVVRRVSAVRPAELHVTLGWDGRNRAGHLVPAGTYYWRFTAVDAAGNSQRTARRVVYVSSKRFVTRTKVITHNGSGYFDVKRYGAVLRRCSGVSRARSGFAKGGALVTNACNATTHRGIMAALFRFAVPRAFAYGNVAVQAYGYVHRGHVPSVISAGVYSVRTDRYEQMSVPFLSVPSSSTAWRGLGTIAGAGHVSARRVIRVGFGVTNLVGPSDFDMRYLKLTLTYYVVA